MKGCVPYRYKRLLVRALHGVIWPFALPARFAHRLGFVTPFEIGAMSLSLVPGRIGQYLRASFYMQTLARCHHDVSVSFLSFFSRPGAEVGRRVYIGSLSMIDDARLDDGATIGSRVSIRRDKGAAGAVRVGRDAWLGEGATVMADVGDACIVGAGAIVDHPVPGGSVVVGNPLRTLCR